MAFFLTIHTLQPKTLLCFSFKTRYLSLVYESIFSSLECPVEMCLLPCGRIMIRANCRQTFHFIFFLHDLQYLKALLLVGKNVSIRNAEKKKKTYEILFLKSFFFLWHHPSKLYHRRSGKLLLLWEWWCLPFSFVWVFGWQARSVLRVQLITCVPIAWHCLPLPAVTCSNTMHRRTNRLHNTSSIRSCSSFKQDWL